MIKLLFMIFSITFGRKRRADAVVPRHFKRNIDPTFELNSMFQVLTHLTFPVLTVNYKLTHFNFEFCLFQSIFPKRA